MQQSFVKTIDGHEIEFNKLMYPNRYQLTLRHPNKNPSTIFVIHANDEWVCDYDKSGMDWDQNLNEQILRVIAENEIIELVD